MFMPGHLASKSQQVAAPPDISDPAYFAAQRKCLRFDCPPCAVEIYGLADGVPTGEVLIHMHYSVCKGWGARARVVRRVSPAPCTFADVLSRRREVSGSSQAGIAAGTCGCSAQKLIN